MINNRIFSWSVWIVLCCALTAPVAVAEQPIIIPVIFMLSPAVDGSDALRSPMGQATLYRSDPGKVSGQTFVSRVCVRHVKNVDNGKQEQAKRYDSTLSACVPLSHTTQNTSKIAEGNRPIVLTVAMNREATANVSIRISMGAMCGVSAEPDRAFIPAVDLMTGEATTVRPEHIKEYQELARFGYPTESIRAAYGLQAQDSPESTNYGMKKSRGGSDVVITPVRR